MNDSHRMLIHAIVFLALAVDCPTEEEITEAENAKVAARQRLDAATEAIMALQNDPRQPQAVSAQTRAGADYEQAETDLRRVKRARTDCLASQAAKQRQQAWEEDREKSRQAAEWKAAAEASREEAEKQRQATTEAAAADPDFRRLALSLLICIEGQNEKEALAGIAAEKRNSKIAGVQDLLLLRTLQNSVVEARENASKYRAAVIGARQKPWPCGSEIVRKNIECALGTGCDGPGQVVLSDVVDYLNLRTE